MSDQNQTRRSFIKGSVAKGLIVTNTAALAGLINTPGTAGGDTTAPGTTQPGSTQPGTTGPRSWRRTYSATSEATGATAEQAIHNAVDIRNPIEANTSSCATTDNEFYEDLGPLYGLGEHVYENSVTIAQAVYSLWDDLYHAQITIVSTHSYLNLV